MTDQKDKAVTATGNEEVDMMLLKAQDFWTKFSKPITYISLAVIVLLGGWWIYRTYVKLPAQEKANELIYPAETLFGKMTQVGFNKDSINIVLNGGNGVATGVLKVASSYGSSPAGNRAKLIAGACYLRLHDYNNAIKYLKDFSSTKSTQVQSTVYSLLGDAYSELKNQDDALSYYKKAAEVNDKDDFISSEALYKEGRYAESIGKTDVAIECYQKIKNDYPKSSHAPEMDKYLARLGVVN